MDINKLEKLHDLVINEDIESADELFHQIVVETSREIYESIVAEEMMDEELGGEVGDLLDQITHEEEGIQEEEELEMDASEEEVEMDDDELFDLSGEEEVDDSEASEEVEDAVIRIEDKLDQLMAEFLNDEGLEAEEDDEAEEEVEDDGEEVMEAVQLDKVSGLYDQKIGGDDGDNKKSPVPANSGKAGMDSDVVNYSGGSDEKGRAAPGTKDVKDAGNFKNVPGQKGKKLEGTPKPETKDSAQNTKSPYAK